ncbi:hypothetical protein BDZ97DRAFT_1787644 [Flammula alnicola]|nr:hypothetical protein BDZ97DRAFT_1787644 [Flammula alnicola]
MFVNRNHRIYETFLTVYLDVCAYVSHALLLMQLLRRISNFAIATEPVCVLVMTTMFSLSARPPRTLLVPCGSGLGMFWVQVIFDVEHPTSPRIRVGLSAGSILRDSRIHVLEQNRQIYRMITTCSELILYPTLNHPSEILIRRMDTDHRRSNSCMS